MALVSPVEAPVRISDAIKKASKATGTNFDYLLTTAARESNFQTGAKAKTSSAAGLFQFIESTWLQTVKEEGAQLRARQIQPPYLQNIEVAATTFPTGEMRQEILQLRHNAEASAMMAGAFTQQNSDYVSSRLGREPTKGELYIAHFLGPGGATKLITLAESRPTERADRQFPKAAAANRGIFYSHGKARNASQVYDLLVSDHSRMESLTIAAADPARANGAGRPATDESLAATAALEEIAEVPPLGVPTGKLPGELVQKTRVAALDQPALAVKTGSMNDAGIGSIGAWTTIVERAEPAAATATAGDRSPVIDAPAPAEQRQPLVLYKTPAPAQRGRAKPSAPIQLPDRKPSLPVRSVPSANVVKLASSAFSMFQNDYWMNMSMSGS